MTTLSFLALLVVGSILIVCLADRFRNLRLLFSGFGFRLHLRGKR
jgi:hypothetical protein